MLSFLYVGEGRQPEHVRRQALDLEEQGRHRGRRAAGGQERPPPRQRPPLKAARAYRLPTRRD
jgi:hypothetical protein